MEVKELRYVVDLLDKFLEQDHNDHVWNWKLQLIINEMIAEANEEIYDQIIALNTELKTIVDTMRYVHYGDYYTHEDHNKFVEAWRKQLEIDKVMAPDFDETSKLETIVNMMSEIIAGDFYYAHFHNLFREAWLLQSSINSKLIAPVAPPLVKFFLSADTPRYTTFDYQALLADYTIIVVGSIREDGIYVDNLIAKFDYDGTLIKCVEFGRESKQEYLNIIRTDGIDIFTAGCVYGGTRDVGTVHLIKLDSDLNLVGVKMFESEVSTRDDYEIYDILLHSNSYVYLAGWMAKYDETNSYVGEAGFVSKFDRDLNHYITKYIMHYAYAGLYDVYETHIIELSDGNILVTSSIYNTDGEYEAYDFMVMKIDQNLNLIKSVKTQNLFDLTYETFAVQDSEGNIYVIGSFDTPEELTHVIVMKFDQNLNLIKAREYYSSYDYHIVEDALIINDYIYIIISQETDTDANFMILKIDKDLNVVKAVRVGADDVIESPNGGVFLNDRIVACGTATGYFVWDGGSPDARLHQTGHLLQIGIDLNFPECPLWSDITSEVIANDITVNVVENTSDVVFSEITLHDVTETLTVSDITPQLTVTRICG